jgi:hypothetical protein
MQRMPPRPTLSIHKRPGIDTYHFVWAEGRRAPRERHATRDAAEGEAARLSLINPGVKYHVYVARRVDTRKVTP